MNPFLLDGRLPRRPFWLGSLVLAVTFAALFVGLERLAGRRLTRDGVLVLVAQGERSQKRNREEALARLVELLRIAARPPTPRKKTRPPKASKRRRLDDKKKHGAVKLLRSNRSFD